jgi:hypothetical protein
VVFTILHLSFLEAVRRNSSSKNATDLQIKYRVISVLKNARDLDGGRRVRTGRVGNEQLDRMEIN